jgi:hypothetical protein
VGGRDVVLPSSLIQLKQKENQVKKRIVRTELYVQGGKKTSLVVPWWRRIDTLRSRVMGRLSRIQQHQFVNSRPAVFVIKKLKIK